MWPRTRSSHVRAQDSRHARDIIASALGLHTEVAAQAIDGQGAASGERLTGGQVLTCAMMAAGIGSDRLPGAGANLQGNEKVDELP